jgi:hypothetical protein
MSEGSSTIYVSLVHLSGLNLTYFVDVVGVNTITPFLGSRLDSLLHDLLDLLLALLAVDIDIPLVPVAQFVLESFRSGTHAVFVDGYTFTAIAIRVERKLVFPVTVSATPDSLKK